MKTNQRLWIFGDSFATLRNGNNSWQLLLKDKFVGKNMIVSGRGGRDIQTIIDIFLKSLHLINEDDFVVMIIPTSIRVRYPIKNDKVIIDYGNISELDGLSESLRDEFTGYNPHSPHHLNNIKKELIYPLNVIDDSLIEDIAASNLNMEMKYDDNKIKSFFNKKLKLSHNEISKLMNTSESVLKNYNRQFYSFSKAFKFKIIFLSWTNDFEIFDKSLVISQNTLEKEIGKFHTQNQMYIDTNGKKGKEGDFHWSEYTDKKISEYIINNNPDYFVK